MFNALALTLKGMTPQRFNIHRLWHGLLGYLIRFAPHAFVPQRQKWSSESLSPLVFLPISMHFTTTPGIPFTSTTLESNSFSRHFQLSLELSQETYKTAYGPFTPSHSGQRLPPTYYRGCWHVVSRDLFTRYRHYLPW